MCVCDISFFFNDTATTEIYTYGHTLSLHDALPIFAGSGAARSDIFARHSKSGADFSMAAREAERAAAKEAHGDEIDKVHAWAIAIAGTADIPLPLQIGRAHV